MIKAKIGIMGGTFNPIHNAHLLVANEVLNQLHLDKIVFMPDNIPPHVNHKDAINVKKRAQMIKLAIASNPKFKLGTSEMKRGGKSYTYDTVKDLKKNHPNNKYYWIIGGDEVAYLHTWYKINQLIKLIQFVGVTRNGSKMESKYSIKWVKIPRFDISSTLIRNRIHNHISVKYLLPDKVIEYIKKNHLYL